MGRTSPPRGQNVGPRSEFDQLDSTQRLAIERARSGAALFERVVARRQTDGRGRLDRRWSSPSGGLYLSIVAPEPGRARSLVPLAIASELARELEASRGIALVVKWPNDLGVVGDDGEFRKLSGVLVDRIETAQGPRLVVGLGLNVTRDAADFPPELRARATSLSELTGAAEDLGEVEEVAAGAVARALDLLGRPHGAAQVIARCRARLYGVGRSVTVDGRSVGLLRSLEDDGALRVEGPEGTTEEVRAGDLALAESR